MTPALRRLTVLAVSVTTLASGLTALGANAASKASSEIQAATVIAIIDSGFSPYHQDFLANRMPQAVANGGTNPLPLDKAPDTWLPGFPKRSTFASFKPLTLTLPKEGTDKQDALYKKDAASWASVKASNPGDIQYRWIPGTKVIGALTFGSQPNDRPVDKAVFGGQPTIYGTGGAEHGMGTSSVAVGNNHGTCPECLFVFIQYTDQSAAERALTWASQQPWIDAISNSYGFSAGVLVRDRVYNGTDYATGRVASERGQTTFFSAGNGLENAFTIPNSTLLSSQEGPDWVVTVGATDPNGKDYTGTGKPADVAGIGTSYPSAYGSTTAQNGDTFGGTSNATPELAGIYAHTLWSVRKAKGWARTQIGGVVARPAGCTTAKCGLTARALRQAIFNGATPTAGGYTDGLTSVTMTPGVADSRFAAEGYGTYRGLLDGRDKNDASLRERVLGPLLRGAAIPSRPAGEVDWFRVDSWCRQHIWGQWTGGTFRSEAATPLPADDPGAWPTRTAIRNGCANMSAPPPPSY